VTDFAFNRTAKIIAWRETMTPGEQLEITDLRIKFKVERSLTKNPNQADLRIYNLAEATRVDLETKPLAVQITAGYDGENHLLFDGDLRFGMSELNDATWESLLQLGDGDRTYANARVASRSYRPGTTVRTILTDVARSAGAVLPKRLGQDPLLDTPYDAGYAAHGFVRDQLDNLLASYGYQWSIQNGQLEVLRDDQVAGADAILIDKDHGMIGTPKFGSPPRSGKPPHMTVSKQLDTGIFPGCTVSLKSRDKSGLFRAERVRHIGDNKIGNMDWRTEVELKPL
jgi:hypothetical protein